MDLDKLPKRSYELIRMLDETIPTPRLPYSADGWKLVDSPMLQAMAYAHGQRALVDELVNTMTEELADLGQDTKPNDTDDTPATGIDRALPEDINVREVSIAAPIRVVSDVAKALLGRRGKEG